MNKNKFPFTPSQWQELEHQALVYKYMASGISIPPDLLFTIRKSFLDSPLSSRLLPNNQQHHCKSFLLWLHTQNAISILYDQLSGAVGRKKSVCTANSILYDCLQLAVDGLSTANCILYDRLFDAVGLESWS